MRKEPIYRQVQRDIEARAEVGKPKYGRYLMADTNGRDPLQDAYEEALDKAKYLKQSIHERRALLAYVARLEGVLIEMRDEYQRQQDEDDERGPTYNWSLSRINYALSGQLLHETQQLEHVSNSYKLASKFSGQPLQILPQSDWRPIAEANAWDGSGNYRETEVVGMWSDGMWITGRGFGKNEAIKRGFTHYHPLSAPPAEVR